MAKKEGTNMKPDAIEKIVEKYLEDMRGRKLQWKESPMEDIRSISEQIQSDIKAMNNALRWLAIVYNIAVAVLTIAFIIAVWKILN